MHEDRASIAKITRPRLTTGTIARERLFHYLDRSRERPVIWVAAPGGLDENEDISRVAWRA